MVKIFKKFIVAAFVVGGMSSISHAWIFEQLPDKTKTVVYSQAVAANISTSAVIIDLSNTTNYPHKETGNINISSIRIDVDKAAASTCTVRLGVVTFVNTSTGSITWFASRAFRLNASNTSPSPFIHYAPNYLNLKAESAGVDVTGTTPNLISNLLTAGSSEFQSDLLIPGTYTSVAPVRGDIILQINNGTAATDVKVEIQYSSEQ